MKRIINLLTAAALSSLLSLPAYAAPLLINYQGRLIDTAGNPLIVTNQPITFRIYDALTGGNLQWTENQSITPDNGIFNVSLGSVSSLPAPVFSSDDRYLEVQIGADSPLSPRTRLLSVPYAVYAANIGSPSSSINVSTHMVLSGGQLRFGNFASAPSVAVGAGAMYYNTTNNQLYYHNGTAWTALAAGGISPLTDNGDGTVTLNVPANRVGLGKAPAEKLDVAGNIKADYGLISATAAVSGAVYVGSGANISTITPTGFFGSGAGLLNVPVGDNTVTSAKIVDDSIMNADINASAAIAKSKLAALNIVNADVDAAAAIAPSKIAGTAAILGANTFTGAQTYAAGSSLAAAAAQPGVAVSTAVFIGTGANISTITPTGFFGNTIHASSATLTGDAEVRGLIKAGSTPAAITDVSGNVLASKLIGAIPQAVTVFVSADCEALTPGTVAQFCYNSTSFILNVSTSTNLGGFAPLH
ncbi:MAG: hypothetical protein FD189_1006 [Elusimicrobia bacterium]|nr:MAG: hypothetical protein FD154_1247 [Elusimicrobiota bacterium]KAF0156453.1 MAG: hypothetical protein FD189_1006 [Elusimicrobiota bacterium]